MPTMKLTSAEPRRASTSLETEAAIPSARRQAKLFNLVKLSEQTLSRRLPAFAFAVVEAVAVVLMVVLLVGRSSSPPPPTARLDSTARVVMATTAPPPAAAPRPATPSTKRAATANQAPAKLVAVNRPPVIRRAAKRVAPVATKKTDCSIPFYYEGRKKIFKPSCI